MSPSSNCSMYNSGSNYLRLNAFMILCILSSLYFTDANVLGKFAKTNKNDIDQTWDSAYPSDNLDLQDNLYTVEIDAEQNMKVSWINDIMEFNNGDFLAMSTTGSTTTTAPVNVPNTTTSQPFTTTSFVNTTFNSTSNTTTPTPHPSLSIISASVSIIWLICAILSSTIFTNFYV